MSRLFPSLLMSLALAAFAATLTYAVVVNSLQGGEAESRGDHNPEIAGSNPAPATNDDDDRILRAHYDVGAADLAEMSAWHRMEAAQ